MALIPPERLTTWTPGTYTGVQGGIPTDRTEFANAVTEGADNTGVVDAQSILNGLIVSCPSGQYVYLPAGTFRIDGSILAASGKSNFTIRGAGIGVTVLVAYGINAVNFGSDSDYQWNEPPGDHTITAGLTQGSTTVTIADTTDFSIGQLCRIGFENEIDDTAITGGATPVFQDNGDTSPQRKQMVKITGKTGTTISFFPGIHHAPQAGLSARINHARVISENVGIEDLTIECEEATVETGVKFSQCLNSWIKNVEVKHCANYPFQIYDSLFCEMRGSYANQGKLGGTNGAGILANNSGGCLIEDNIVRECFPAIEVNQGSSGNVIAFNLLEGTATVAATMNINHGPHNSHNLYEGNIAPSVQSDGFFGGASEDTIFRNWFSGTNSVAAYQTFLVSLNRFTRNYSLVGNILGTSVWPYGSTPYSFGNPNIGNSYFYGTSEMTTGDFPIDWKMTATLTTRTNDTTGVFTLISGSIRDGQFRAYWYHGGSGGEIIVPDVLTGAIDVGDETLRGFAGATVGFTTDATLPAQGEVVTIWAGIGGFQDSDLDVENTTLLKANYNNFAAGGDEIPAAQDPSPDTVPDSLFRSSKPSFFGDLLWPAIDPYLPSTANYEAIPAGYRYINGSNPPSDSTLTCTTLNVTTLTLG